ncbi:N-acetylmuramoyl-L-alanine amidase [bacterium]|nr:N-acetylmuramoyl-L-alanine amidase [bacterium]
MNKFFIVLGAILIAQSAFALDIVYPKKTTVKINSPSTFFIGSADPQNILRINDEIVQVHSSGGFAHVVQLQEGENFFVIQSGEEIINFVINRTKRNIGKMSIMPSFVQYDNPKEFITSSDYSPLRATPVDAGINRLSHFQEGVPVIVDGEKNNFYRVILGENKKAWIAKSNVKEFEGGFGEPAEVLNYDYIDEKEYYKFIFHLDKKVPYEIIEGETFYLRLYNMKNCPENTYEFSFPYAEASENVKIVGYSAEYDGNDFVWKIRKYPKINLKRPLKNIRIAVDPGHGGNEFGAIGCCGDKEKDITLAISKYLKDELKNRGAKVIMTREDDVYVGLRERVDIANENDAMFLISIHGNALPDHLNPLEHRGTSIYYYYNQAKLLAANVLLTMNEQLGTQNDKIRQGSLALVRNTNAVSILIEVAYLINPEDNVLLIDPEFQKKCAKSIADGIENYLR